MPNEQQIESAMAEIDRVRSSDEYSGGAAGRFLALREIEWAGFSQDEELLVIGRILNMRPREDWMAGINSMDLEQIKATDAWQKTEKIEAYLDAAPEREIALWQEEMESRDSQDSTPLFEEMRQDEHAARVRDYGATDAATYEQRVAEGAAMPIPEWRPEFNSMMRDIANPPRLEEPSSMERAGQDGPTQGDTPASRDPLPHDRSEGKNSAEAGYSPQPRGHIPDDDRRMSR